MSTKPIRELSLLEWMAMSEGEQGSIYLDSINPKAATLDDLKAVIEDFVHLSNLQACPVKMSTVNRRFYRPAKVLGLTTLDAVKMLVNEGKLQLQQVGMNSLLSTVRSLDDLETHFQNVLADYPASEHPKLRRERNERYNSNAR